MDKSQQSASSENSVQRHPYVGLLCLSVVALTAYLVVRNWHDTIVSKRLDSAGVAVEGALMSADIHGGSGARRSRGRPTADVTYSFDFAGRHFVDTDEDVEARAIESAMSSHQVKVTVLPTDPAAHRIEPGHKSRDWEGAIAGTLFSIPFFFIFGLLGVACYFPRAEKPIPAPPPAEFFVRPEPFFDAPAPRRVRWRMSNIMWTAFWTILLLVPPAYAAAQWSTYLAHRAPSEPFWPWNSWTMMNCIFSGIPYFAVGVPMYIVRLARIRRCARLARFGCTTTGVVDWKLRVAWDTAKRKRATIKIDGVTVGELPGKEDWVTYHYTVDGKAHTGESADGRAVLWRSHAIPPAVYLPTGREITVVYDPRNPADSLLLPYLRYYFNLNCGNARLGEREDQ